LEEEIKDCPNCEATEQLKADSDILRQQCADLETENARLQRQLEQYDRSYDRLSNRLGSTIEQNRMLQAVANAVRTTIHVKTCYETDDYGDCACGVCVALAALDKHDRTQP
jgi:predicted nuclease with TOPRIM domain